MVGLCEGMTGRAEVTAMVVISVVDVAATVVVVVVAAVVVAVVVVVKIPHSTSTPS